MAVHYTNLFNTCSNTEGLGELACKIGITLLRYSHIIPTDKLFYQAGSIAKKQDRKNLGFILLNR